MTASTLDEERTEVWTSILDDMPDAAVDADHAAACRYLVRHLIESARPIGERRSPRQATLRDRLSYDRVGVVFTRQSDAKGQERTRHLDTTSFTP